MDGGATPLLVDHERLRLAGRVKARFVAARGPRWSSDGMTKWCSERWVDCRGEGTVVVRWLRYCMYCRVHRRVHEGRLFFICTCEDGGNSCVRIASL